MYGSYSLKVREALLEFEVGRPWVLLILHQTISSAGFTIYCTRNPLGAVHVAAPVIPLNKLPQVISHTQVLLCPSRSASWARKFGAICIAPTTTVCLETPQDTADLIIRLFSVPNFTNCIDRLAHSAQADEHAVDRFSL